ncbi:MAG: FecR domain-containing protein [Deltaproteobacteria bacterium]|nr:FecR domain-containing protein [Deltaproteobacteria bacterium]
MIAATFALCLALGADATVVSVTGKVDIEPEAGGAAHALVRFATVPAGSTLVTYEGAFAAVRFPDGSLIRLGERTRLTVGRVEQHEPAARRNTKVRLAVGKVWARVMDLFGDDSRFELETPNAVAGVRGTAFFATANDRGDSFTVDFGAIGISRGSFALDLGGAGASTSTTAQGFAPPARMSPEALTRLRAQVSGPSGALVDRLRHDAVAGPPPAARRESLRRTLTGPDGVADTPLAPTRPGAQLRGTAEVTVRVQMPAR